MDNVIVVETKLLEENEANDTLSLETVNGSRIDNGVILIGSQDLNCQVDLGSSVTKCCVPNCSTSRVNNIRSSQITFVTFPKDPSRFTEWIRAIGRLDLLCFLGKKEATNLLICSKHFPQSMWVNSNTRLKRLHKNAVPELSYDDDIDIIAITPVSEKTLSAKKSGIKVKKVTSLLTDSALRESLSSPDKTSSSISMLNNSPVVDSPRLDIRGRKLPLILPRPKNLTTPNATSDELKRPKIVSRPSLKVTEPSGTELKKKLALENKNLKEELDKNMDNILSQKAHYEGLISKEKQTIKELEDKIKRLECSQLTFHQIESQKQTKKQEAELREMSSTIKRLQQLDELNRKRLDAETQTIQNLKAMNNELQLQIEDFLQEKELAAFTHSPVSTRPIFTGENFKDFLYLHLEKESNLEEKVNDLMFQIDKSVTPEGQKKNILNIASQHLNHLHLSWLKWILNMKERTEADFDDRLQELALSIYEVSREAYVICAKAFGLPSPEIVEKWAKVPSSSKGTITSTINALYDEVQPLPNKELLNQTTCDTDKGFDDTLLNSEGKRRKNHWKQTFYCKKLKSHIDDEEEGRVSDEDEEVVFTDSEDEDEDELENDVEIITKEEPPNSKNIAPSSKVGVPVASTSSQDFDFIVEGESLEVQRGETSLVSENLQPEQHVHMPLLDLDSSMTTQREIVNGTSATDLKISNRKKVISSDTSLPSGSKVVFRVIES